MLSIPSRHRDAAAREGRRYFVDCRESLAPEDREVSHGNLPVAGLLTSRGTAAPLVACEQVGKQTLHLRVTKPLRLIEQGGVPKGMQTPEDGSFACAACEQRSEDHLL